MIYLASPYSHPDPLIVKTRFLLVEQEVAHYLKKGVWVYSPIVHCHELACKFDLPKDSQFWERYNVDMLRRADALWVLCIKGWEESRGVKNELCVANTLCMPIEYRIRECE